MRFLQSEHQAIQAAIAASGFSTQDFSSVKRQGKLHMYYRDHPTPFKFFRKKVTQLNAAGKWEPQTIYLIYKGGKSSETAHWETVMTAFREWLATL